MKSDIDRPKPPKGLVDRLRHFERNQIESGDEYGAEVLHRAAEEIVRLTRERDEARAAGTQIKELERLIVERRPVWYAYVESVRRHDQELQVYIKERDSLLARVTQLQEELDKARQHNAELRKQNAVLQNDLDDWAGVPDVK